MSASPQSRLSRETRRSAAVAAATTAADAANSPAAVIESRQRRLCLQRSHAAGSLNDESFRESPKSPKIAPNQGCLNDSSFRQPAASQPPLITRRFERFLVQYFYLRIIRAFYLQFYISCDIFQHFLDAFCDTFLYFLKPPCDTFPYYQALSCDIFLRLQPYSPLRRPDAHTSVAPIPGRNTPYPLGNRQKNTTGEHLLLQMRLWCFSANNGAFLPAQHC